MDTKWSYTRRSDAASPTLTPVLLLNQTFISVRVSPQGFHQITDTVLLAISNIRTITLFVNSLFRKFS